MVPRLSACSTALIVVGILLLLNRAFGFGNVLIGIMPLDVFAGFSISFVAGAWPPAPQAAG